MKLTYYGHSCFGAELDQHTILFDPFITPNELAEKIEVSGLRPDYLLLSHGHEDHIADAEKIIRQCEPLLISSFEVTNYFSDKGSKKARPMNHGGQAQFDFGRVKFVNAVHSSSMPDGSYGGNPGGFVISTDSKSFYFAGDTALTYDMKLLGEYEQLDFAILPIGDNFTMGIDDAIIASDFIQCDKIIGCHYDTFPPIKINHEQAIEKFKQAGKELILMQIGSGIEL